MKKLVCLLLGHKWTSLYMDKELIGRKYCSRCGVITDDKELDGKRRINTGIV